MMPHPTFKQNPDEAILYQSQPITKWYRIIWKIAVSFFEVAVFILFSVTAFTALSRSFFGLFLPGNIADVISRILFQAIAPVLLTAWFAEDTAGTFTSRVVLTTRRIWFKGSPYSWTPGHEIPMEAIKSMYARRDALFISLRETKKLQVHTIQDGDLVVQAFKSFTGKGVTE
jgi:hypothetical protein